MHGFFDVLSYEFMQYALAAAIITGLSAPAVGTFVVQRRLVQGDQRLVIRRVRSRDRLLDDRVATARVGMELEIEREQFLRGAAERMNLESVSHFLVGHDRGVDHDFVRAGQHLLRQDR